MYYRKNIKYGVQRSASSFFPQNCSETEYLGRSDEVQKCRHEQFNTGLFIFCFSVSALTSDYSTVQNCTVFNSTMNLLLRYCMEVLVLVASSVAVCQPWKLKIASTCIQKKPVTRDNEKENFGFSISPFGTVLPNCNNKISQSDTEETRLPVSETTCQLTKYPWPTSELIDEKPRRSNQSFELVLRRVKGRVRSLLPSVDLFGGLDAIFSCCGVWQFSIDKQ